MSGDQNDDRNDWIAVVVVVAGMVCFTAYKIAQLFA